ncbi:MAG: redoxin family protein [Labilithrix sp.]|nr:redoxin family protein [Labilithrix sp.]MCW5817903.1 redoxin family protein [Labilithrix sp.]
MKPLVLGAALLAFVSACKDAPPPVVASPPVAPTTTTTAVAPPAPVLRGRVLGRDGAPMPLAHVHRRGPDDKIAEEIAVAADGAFSLPLPKDARGIVKIELTGAGHRRSEVLIVPSDGAVDLDVRLGTYTPRTPPATEPVAVLFRGREQLGRHRMKRQDDGTFVAEVPLADGTYGYEIAGLVNQNASFAVVGDGWQYDDGGDYTAALTASGGTARVIYDPAKLPPATEAVVRAGAPGSMTARVNEIEKLRAAAQAEVLDELKAGRKAGTPSKPEQIAPAIAAKRAAYLAATKDDRPLVRAFATIGYFSIGFTNDTTDAERAMAREIAHALAPDDPLWSPSAEGLLAVAKDEEVNTALIEQHPNADLVAMLLRMRLFEKKDLDERRRIIALLKTPRLRGTFEATFAMSLDPDRVLAAGKPMPAFEVPALDGDRLKGTHSTKALAGKVYLIDVWSTWCGPCVDQMPKLHELHAKYGKRAKKRFEILSVALDEKPETAAKFRADKSHPMPWLNGVAGPEAKNNPFYAAMGWDERAAGIPFMVLVDANGKIVDSSPDLRIEALPALLDRLLQ